MAEYIAPIGNGLKIQAGKINTLIGYEVINAWENPNFSRTMMFGLSQAFTTTGIRFTYPFAKWATASIGFDQWVGQYRRQQQGQIVRIPRGPDTA